MAPRPQEDTDVNKHWWLTTKTVVITTSDGVTLTLPYSPSTSQTKTLTNDDSGGQTTDSGGDATPVSTNPVASSDSLSPTVISISSDSTHIPMSTSTVTTGVGSGGGDGQSGNDGNGTGGNSGGDNNGGLSQNSSGGPSTGAIVGGVVGGIGGAILILLLVFCCCGKRIKDLRRKRRRKHKHSKSETTEDDAEKAAAALVAGAGAGSSSAGYGRQRRVSSHGYHDAVLSGGAFNTKEDMEAAGVNGPIDEMAYRSGRAVGLTVVFFRNLFRRS